jgi:hypothetical protein
MAEPHDGSITGWVLGGVATIVATLTTVVAALYKKLDANNAKTILALEARCDLLDKRNDLCESDRVELHKICAKHEVEIAMLKERTKPTQRGDHHREQS